MRSTFFFSHWPKYLDTAEPWGSLTMYGVWVSFPPPSRKGFLTLSLLNSGRGLCQAVDAAAVHLEHGAPGEIPPDQEENSQRLVCKEGEGEGKEEVGFCG